MFDMSIGLGDKNTFPTHVFFSNILNVFILWEGVWKKRKKEKIFFLDKWSNRNLQVNPLRRVSFSHELPGQTGHFKEQGISLSLSLLYRSKEYRAGITFLFLNAQKFCSSKKKKQGDGSEFINTKTCPPLKEEKMEHQKWFDWPFTLRGNLSFIGRSNFSLSFKREEKKKNKRRPCAFWKHFYSIAIESTRRKFVLCRSISFWMHYRRTKEPVPLFEHWKSTCCLFQQQQKNLFRYQTLLPIRWGL